MIGEIIDGRYEVTRQLGEGGMGAVYEALHTGTGRRVAVKIILNGDLAKDADMVARFQREARAAGSIDTSHIVQVLDTGTDKASNRPYMVMELLKGEDLSQLVQRVGPLPPEIAARIGAQAALGLMKAHDSGVVHRDIKPANLYLAERDDSEIIVKVLDFGIAKIKHDETAKGAGDHGLTRTGSMLGSPLYMSPEQATGQKTVDQRTDIWSLGAVLYEALAGHAPHASVESLGMLILTICSQPAPLIQDVAPWVPAELAAIVHGALRIDVGSRYPNMREMADAFRRLLPQGFALRRDMLVGIDPRHRAYVAPRIAVSGPAAVGYVAQAVTALPGGGGSSSDASTATVSVPPEAAARVPDGGQASGAQLAMARTRAAPGARSLAAPIALGAALLLGGGGLALYKLRPAVLPVASGEPGPLPSTSASAAEEPVAAPEVVPATGAAALDKTVEIVIEPADATVLVDGAEMSAPGGRIKLTGALGSVHRVTVRAGARESTGEVVITAQGALPDRVALAAAATKPSPGAPRPAPTPAPAPTGRPKDPGLSRTFE